jgi:hypothetical protein
MRWFYTIPLRLRSLFWRRRVEQGLDDELLRHVEQRKEEGVVGGLTDQEARYAVLGEQTAQVG